MSLQRCEVTSGRQLCCHFCSRHDLGITGILAFPARDGESSWLVDFLFQGLKFLVFVRMNTLTYEWSLASPTPTNQKSGSQGPSNHGRGLQRSSQLAADRLQAFILDFPVVFHSQKERGKVRKKKILPFIKKPALAQNVLTCFCFFHPDELQELHFVYLVSCLYLFCSWKAVKTVKRGSSALHSHQIWHNSAQEYALLHSWGFKVCATWKPQDLKFPSRLCTQAHGEMAAAEQNQEEARTGSQSSDWICVSVQEHVSWHTPLPPLLQPDSISKPGDTVHVISYLMLFRCTFR